MLSKVANGSPTHQKDAHSRFRLLNRFTYLWMNSGEEWFTLFRGPSVCHCVMKCPAITINEPVDEVYGAGHYDFDAGQRHYGGHWKGWAMKVKTALAKQELFGPKKVETLMTQPFLWPK